MTTYKRRTVEISVERIGIIGAGAEDGTARRLVVARLIWPRATIAEKTSVLALDFKGGIYEPGSRWLDRIIFKETVQGKFGLSIELSDVVTDSQLSGFLRYATGSLLGMAGDEAGDLMSGAIGAGMAGIPFKYLKGVIGGADEDSTRFVGEAETDLDAGGSEKSGSCVKISMPFTARETIYRTERVQKGGEMASRKRAIWKKGEVNGEIVIGVQYCE